MLLARLDFLIACPGILQRSPAINLSKAAMPCQKKKRLHRRHAPASAGKTMIAVGLTHFIFFYNDAEHVATQERINLCDWSKHCTLGRFSLYVFHCLTAFVHDAGVASEA